MFGLFRTSIELVRGKIDLAQSLNELKRVIKLVCGTIE